jgi:RNA polymerase sigma factor (sigma-70 family)
MADSAYTAVDDDMPTAQANVTLEEGRGALDRRRPDGLSTARALGSRSDEELVAALRRGEQSAFDTLAARYEKRLLFFCRQILRSKEDAEDALQDVFAAAFNAIVADARAIQVRPWLYRVARNRCINQLRRATTVGVDSMDDRYADGDATLMDKVLSRQNFSDLVTDVKSLPDAQRVALLLREIDGFAYERIAIAMGTTVPAVKSLLVRARSGLQHSAAVREAAVVGLTVTPRPKRNRSRTRTGAGPLTYQAALATASAAVDLRPVSTTSLSVEPQKRRGSTTGGGRPVTRPQEATGGLSACRADN